MYVAILDRNAAFAHLLVHLLHHLSRFLAVVSRHAVFVDAGDAIDCQSCEHAVEVAVPARLLRLDERVP